MHKTMRALALLAAIIFTPCYAADENVASKNMPLATEALEIYRTAISMRTVEGQAQVPVLANFLADKFRAAGFADSDIHVLPVGEAAALVVRYRGDGSAGKKPISISAHMDVVEALPDDWERDPFTLVEENGYFYGRGTEDDMAGLTAVTYAFLRLKAEGFVPNRDLIIAFSGDEETTMLSTQALVNKYRKLTDSEFVLNADAGGAELPEDGGPPTSFELQAAEKTYATWELTVTNPGGHSSLPRKDNAIYELAAALLKIQAYQFPVVQNELTKAYFEGTGKMRKDEIGTAMLAFAEDSTDQAAIDTLRADPAIVGKLGTTCITTMIRGGHAENALPQSATATVNCRIFPGVGVDVTRAALEKVVGNAGVKIKSLSDPVETDPSELRDEVIAALQKAVDSKYPGLTIIPGMSSGGTDGMHFRAAGIRSYGVNGIYIKSSDVFAHGLNERLAVQSFYDNLQHWYVLLKAIAGSK